MRIPASEIKPGDRIDGDTVAETAYSSVDGTLWFWDVDGDVLAVADYHDTVEIERTTEHGA